MMTKEELQTRIDNVRDALDGMDDVETVRTSAEFMRALLAQLDAANARIAELEAWKAAVPVDAIRAFYKMSDPDDDTWEYWEDYREPYQSASTSVSEWLDKVQP